MIRQADKMKQIDIAKLRNLVRKVHETLSELEIAINKLDAKQSYGENPDIALKEKE